jgi:hypothetical protein
MKKQKTETHQEVRITLDISITFRAEHDCPTLARMVLDGAQRAWPNNAGTIHNLSMTEEAAMYSGEGETVALIKDGVYQSAAFKKAGV